MSAPACIGEPVSWLRLETLALGERDAAATAHLAACPACAACLAEIRADVVALPPLRAPARAPRRAWWRWAIPALGLAAAAAIALLVARPRAPVPGDERVATVKGVGEVVLDLVRDRDGVIAVGVATSRAGDRWKLVVTCAPGAAAWIDVAVEELGARAAPDYPLAPAHVACGNRVVVPGAFALTGARPNRVCAVLGADAAPPRPALAGSLPADGVACVTVTPE